jgi:hypothetical protein
MVAILERVHFLLNRIGGLAQPSAEQVDGLKHRQPNFLVTVFTDDFDHGLFNHIEAFRFAWVNVPQTADHWSFFAH